MLNHTKKKYKICWICYSISDYGGVIKRLELWSKYFDRSKFELTFIFSSPCIEKVNNRLSKYPWIKLVPFPQLGSRNLSILAGIYKLYREINKGKFDLILTMYTRTDLITGLICKIIGRQNLFSYTAGTALFAYHVSLKKFLCPLLYKFVQEEFACFVSVSEYDKESWLVKKCSVPPSKVYVNRIGINFNEFQIKKYKRSDLVFGFAARFSPEKGIKYLIEAFDLLQKENKAQFKLLLAGNGPLKEFYEKQVLDLGLQNKIYFLGWIHNISDFLNEIDVLILPSLSEGTPRIILEAYVHNIPVIATNIGGIPEILKDGETGFIVQPQSARELKDKMDFFIAHPSCVEEMGFRARNYVTKFHDARDEIKRLEEIYIRSISKWETSKR